MRARRLPSAPMLAVAACGLVWAVPFLWMAVASFRPGYPDDIASLVPHAPLSLDNYAEAWSSGHFPLWYANTLAMCLGILAIQCVTVTLAGYAFARLRFRGSRAVFILFLLQLLLVPALLIVPNLQMLVTLGLYDTLAGVAAPYLASAFGVFLMRQTFRQLPRDYEEAAALDGAGPLRIIWHVLLPMARPGLAAFAVISLTAHWNEYVWPLMATTSPQHQVLTVGLASFAGASEGGGQWGVVAAGTALVAAPLLLLFLVFQRRIVSSFVFSGIK